MVVLRINTRSLIYRRSRHTLPSPLSAYSMRRHTTLSALILSSILSVPTNAQARCYDISGNLASDDSFVPCNSTASVSACCASNKEFPDICLEGGLCYATHAQYTGFIYGNGCTDRSGKDSACPQICPGGMFRLFAHP